MWIEKDDKEGRTSPTEYVAEGQAVDKDVIVRMKCAYCKCKDEGFECSKEESCGES